VRVGSGSEPSSPKAVGELQPAADIKAQWSLDVAVRGAEARGCGECVSAHSFLALVGKGNGEGEGAREVVGWRGHGRRKGAHCQREVRDDPDGWVPSVSG
jgi:hypothetical protein